MNKFKSPLSVMLLLAGSLACAEGDSSADLRYCLDLKSNDEIAKCAGEISPGKKAKPFSKKEVEKILSQEKTTAPIKTDESSGTPATAGDKPAKDLLLEKKTEGNGN